MAIEDDRTSLKRVTEDAAEPARVMENLGEFPAATTDEGDRQQYPARRLARGRREGGLLRAFMRRN